MSKLQVPTAAQTMQMQNSKSLEESVTWIGMSLHIQLCDIMISCTYHCNYHLSPVYYFNIIMLWLRVPSHSEFAEKKETRGGKKTNRKRRDKHDIPV